MRVHVALGGNLGDRVARIEAACAAMRALAIDGELVLSPLYESEPMGPTDQPDYVNAVCRFRTDLSPPELLARLQGIEASAGRVRPAPRWSARTLDLDILLCGDLVIDSADLVVPHPGLAERAFVLRPLVDLDSTLEVPGLGPVGTLLDRLDQSGLRPLAR